jgi:hypothetical protein
MASRMDRAAWGDAAPAVNLNLKLGQLHLDALRALEIEDDQQALEAKATQQLPPAGEVDVELVQD